MSVLIVEYDPDATGTTPVADWRYVADDDYEPGPGEFAADARAVDHRDLGSRMVDTTTDPVSLADDPTNADLEERKRIRELSEIRKRIARIEEEIADGYVPSRSENANVDAVLSEWETRRDDLRSLIG